MKWYWFQFDNLRLTLHLRRDFSLRWSGIYGLQVGSWFFGVIRGDQVAAVAAAEGPSAGDLLIRACDLWVAHSKTCKEDDCATCQAHFNQMVLAHKVWKSSAHQTAIETAR